MGTAVAFLEKAFGNKEEIETWLRIGSVFLLFLCLFSRTCMYLFPKDLWLDEGYLYELIRSKGFSELLQGHLGTQSAPIFFVIINKLLLTYVGSDVALLYFLPFICSVISVITLFFLSHKIGDWFYVFFTMLIFSLCFTATYYSNEFKQYGMELLVSLLLLFSAIKNIEESRPDHQVLSHKTLFFYCVCILCSSTAVLFIVGIILAEILICWRRHSLKSLNINYGSLLVLIIFISAYYFLYLKSGNSPHMKNYWQRYFIPLDWASFWKYWPDVGVKIFHALFFGPLKSSVFVLAGVAGGSILLWRQKREYFLLLSLPVVVTLAANAFFYPPGHPWGAPIGGRLLLFLLPNGVLVAAWFYAWALSRLASGAMRAGSGQGRVLAPGLRRGLCAVVLCGLVLGSAVANAKYLYGMDYRAQQIRELVRVIQSNSTPESLNLVYAGSYPAYQYYSALGGKKPPVESMPWAWEAVRARLEDLPENRRVFILFSQPEIARKAEAVLTARGRTFFKIPGYRTMLFILPEKEGDRP